MERDDRHEYLRPHPHWNFPIEAFFIAKTFSS